MNLTAIVANALGLLNITRAGRSLDDGSGPGSDISGLIHNAASGSQPPARFGTVARRIHRGRCSDDDDPDVRRRAIASILTPSLFAGIGLLTAWGVAIAVARLRRSDDLFVVHRFGLARHHDSGITRTRWVDIVSVDQVGPGRGSRLARWNGSDYVCRIERRDGTTITFDNYIVDAPSLGRAIEQRSLL